MTRCAGRLSHRSHAQVLDALHGQIEATEGEIDATTMRIIRKVGPPPRTEGIRALTSARRAQAEEARGVGASTLESLHAQGKQLDDIARGQQEIKANLTASDRLLTGA